MTTCVHRTPDISNPKVDAEFLEITKEVPFGEFTAIKGAKDQRELVFEKVSIQDLAKLNAHWYESMLISLSFDRKRAVVKIHIRAKKADQLLSTKASVNRGKRKGIKSPVRTLDGLPVYYPTDMVRAERR